MKKSQLALVGLLLAFAGCQQSLEKNQNRMVLETPDTPAMSPTGVATKVAEPSQPPSTEEKPKAPDNVTAKPMPAVDAPAVKEAAPATTPAEEPAPRKIAIVRRTPRKIEPDAAPTKVVLSAPPKMPVLLMSEEHAATCLVKVGDVLPDANLPDTDGQTQSLANLRGQNLTVVFFWSTSDRHSLQQLEDMGPDVASLFETQGVEVIGINVWDVPVIAKDAAAKFEPTYPMLFDSKGSYFNQIATGRPPRTMLLDKDGKIVWLDIEYTRITRRHLHEAVLFLLQTAKTPAS